jgi:hypothetical protein
VICPYIVLVILRIIFIYDPLFVLCNQIQETTMITWVEGLCFKKAGILKTYDCHLTDVL